MPMAKQRTKLKLRRYTCRCDVSENVKVCSFVKFDVDEYVEMDK